VTLRSAAEDDEYLPEYGLLVIRDHYEPGRFDGPDDVVDGLDALEESGTAEYPVGTVAGAGVAWLRARAASNQYHRVRLEAHDHAPADDADHWAQVMESPYFCRTGGVFLTMVTGSDADTVLPLGIGLHRVRVCSRPADDEGDVWRLQFWPDPLMEPPRWLKRTPTGTDLRHQDLAGDLISVLLWTGLATTTVAALAQRLHVEMDAVTAAITSELGRYLRLEAGELTQPLRPVVLAVQPRPALPPAATVAPAPVAVPGPPWQPVPATPEPPPQGTGMSWTSVGGPPQMVTYRPPPGPPPRAGYISDTGHLMIWRDSDVAPIAQVPSGAAVETAHGILITGSTGTVIVRDDGTIDDLDLSSTYSRLDEHGRLYAVVEWHLGRQEWYRLHVLDLADGFRRTMPWDDSQPLTLNAVHDGVIRFNTDMQWRPGNDPEPAPYPVTTIDPVSGTSFYYDPQQGPTIITPDGTRRRFTASYDARPAPGGDRLYEFGHTPASLILFDAITSRTTQTYWLPPRSQTSPTGPQPPVWEDPDHLLVHVRSGVHDIGTSLIRLNVRTGDFQAVPLAGQPDYARLVQPLLTDQASPNQ
jgi:hypothetical protein